MDCKIILHEELIEKYLLGQLNQQQKEDMLEHLSSCESCAIELEQQKLLLSGLQSFGQKELRSELRQQLAERRKNKKVTNWTIYYKAAAILVVLVFLPGLIYYYSNIESPVAIDLVKTKGRKSAPRLKEKSHISPTVVSPQPEKSASYQTEESQTGYAEPEFDKPVDIIASTIMDEDIEAEEAVADLPPTEETVQPGFKMNHIKPMASQPQKKETGVGQIAEPKSGLGMVSGKGVSQMERHEGSLSLQSSRSATQVLSKVSRAQASDLDAEKPKIWLEPIMVDKGHWQFYSDDQMINLYLKVWENADSIAFRLNQTNQQRSSLELSVPISAYEAGPQKLKVLSVSKNDSKLLLHFIDSTQLAIPWAIPNDGIKTGGIKIKPDGK